MAASGPLGPVTRPPYEPPSWAGKPPPGLHLDVMKGDKLIEKLIIDEKKCYLFGRNPDVCDHTIDHQSCSRIHSALIYHKHLKRIFIIDLNSTHGTYLGQIRLEPHKPQQVPVDSTLKFGASTRHYTLRERPQTLPPIAGLNKTEEKTDDEDLKGGLLGLPEEETELDNLTEFNTAHNKRIATITIEEGNLDMPRTKRRRKNSHVNFSEDEEIINPEDVDPSVGRFRNMVQTAVIPLKKKSDMGGSQLNSDGMNKRLHNLPFTVGLYTGIPPSGGEHGMVPTSPSTIGVNAAGTTLIGGLPIPLPNPAPDVDLVPPVPQVPAPTVFVTAAVVGDAVSNEPRKKKYAKEAWPGKKPTPSLLI
uniref:nuclear inhibitor of protein phosphatase 1 isoform X1 n=2 Tax=Myxine glutinosa TaxID=7769 RepID=UPI00358ED23E